MRDEREGVDSGPEYRPYDDDPDDPDGASPRGPEPLRWRLPLALFVLTVLSTLYIGASFYVEEKFPSDALEAALARGAYATAAARALSWLALGWQYAVPLLTILLCHEFGHYLMARRHGVPASLPMFIPVPMPPFGTMGAVIRMRGRIAARNALVDIGAAGPLAGLAVALPVTYVGLRWSPVYATVPHGLLATERGMFVGTTEGTSLIYALLKLVAKGPIPSGHDVLLHPVAMAGWVGLFVTMINLIPYGQLDGGHVAYALLGRLHDRFVRYVAWGLVALGVGTGLYWGTALARAGRNPWAFGTGYTQGFNWFMFALLITLLHRGTAGRHPPTDPGELSSARRIVAALTLVAFVALFMPVPLRMDG